MYPNNLSHRLMRFFLFTKLSNVSQFLLSRFLETVSFTFINILISLVSSSLLVTYRRILSLASLSLWIINPIDQLSTSLYIPSLCACVESLTRIRNLQFNGGSSLRPSRDAFSYARVTLAGLPVPCKKWVFRQFHFRVYYGTEANVIGNTREKHLDRGKCGSNLSDTQDPVTAD